MIKHQVEPGDCLLSIGSQYGLPWDFIWNHPDNADLKKLRVHPGILMPGDVVVVPDPTPKEFSFPTSQRHKLVVKRPQALIRLQVFDGEKPRANQSYTLIVDGVTFSGTTDGNGVVEKKVPPDAAKAELTIGPDKVVHSLDLGHMDPSSESSGVAGRLENLGYFSGDPDDQQKLRRSLLLFQRRFGLQESGTADDATVKKLADLHDNVGSFPVDDGNQSNAGGG